MNECALSHLSSCSSCSLSSARFGLLRPVSMASQSSVKNTKSYRDRNNKNSRKTQVYVWSSCSSLKVGKTRLTGSHPVTDSGDDGEQVLGFPLQQDHSELLSAALAGMVQHHVEKVTQFVGDACVLER